MQIAPYISDHKRSASAIRAYLFTVLGLVALYGLFFGVQWLMLRSPVFRVDHVVVQGASAVASTDVIALAEASAIPGAYIFLGALTFNNMLLWPEASRRANFS